MKPDKTLQKSRKLDRLRTAAIALCAGGVLLLAGGGTRWALAVVVTGILVYLFVLEKRLEATRKRIERGQADTLRQVEAAADIRRFIDLGAQPLPPSGSWAASSDLLSTLARLVAQRKPETIVELGSGLSTLIMAYSLRHNGAGRLVSLDHDPEYAEATRDLLRSHGLSSLVEVVHAPLEEQDIGSRRCKWYRESGWQGLPEIDLLVVDGPPATTQPRARSAALDALHDRLSSNALVVVDDAKRPEDFETVQTWSATYGMSVDWLDLEKGAAILRLREEESDAQPAKG